MGAWCNSLRPLCDRTCAGLGGGEVDAVLYYLARWCQKATGQDEPDTRVLLGADLEDVATRIARNLAHDAVRVEELVAGDAEAWTELRRVLVASATPRAGVEAGGYADDAMQRIALVLLTGTAPGDAVERLQTRVAGPRNEYIFQSPFEFWARAVVIHTVVDDQRRAAREVVERPAHAGGELPAARAGQPTAPRASAEAYEVSSPGHSALLRRALDALPGLLDAVRVLPPVQRSILIFSLWRRGLDDVAREHLRQLAPDLFPGGDELLSSDWEIAERLETTPRLVAANRSAARRKLARREPLWALLLDVLLPHRSTRPLAAVGDPRSTDA